GRQGAVVLRERAAAAPTPATRRNPGDLRGVPVAVRRGRRGPADRGGLADVSLVSHGGEAHRRDAARRKDRLDPARARQPPVLAASPVREDGRRDRGRPPPGARAGGAKPGGGAPPPPLLLAAGAALLRARAIRRAAAPVWRALPA